MVTMIISGLNAIADFARFLADVWRDARAMRDEAQDRYGLMGF